MWASCIYIHIYTHVMCIYVCMYAYMSVVYMYLWIYLCTHACTQARQYVRTYLYTSVCKGMYVHMLGYVRMYVCMYVCIMYVYMYVCIYGYTHMARVCSLLWLARRRSSQGLRSSRLLSSVSGQSVNDISEQCVGPETSLPNYASTQINSSKYRWPQVHHIFRCLELISRSSPYRLCRMLKLRFSLPSTSASHSV